MRMQGVVWCVVSLALCCAAGGCLFGPKKSAPPLPPQAGAEKKAPMPGFFARDAQMMEKDPVPEPQYLIQLLTYKITLPAGAVSRNDEFWKHVNEQALDVPTYELLSKNGVRVGVAASAEWDYMKEVLKDYPAMTQPSVFSGREAKDIELEMKLKVPYQNLFYFDTRGDLIGRTFERCDNLMRASFQPAPRKHGTVRLALCPVVRSLREEIVAVGDVNTVTREWVHPERFFELNLTADVPLDGFMVVAPSAEGKWPTSLGATFLVNDGTVEQTETVLIFRPLIYRQRFDPKGVATTRP